MKKNSPDAVMPSSERDLGKRLRRRTNFVEICKYFDKENFEENGRAGSTSNTEKDEIKIWEFDIDLSGEKSNRISPKSKSRKTGIGLECQLPENSHLKKDTPGGLTPVKKTNSQEHREVRKLEPFEDNEIIFKISRFNYVGLWQWDVDTDICAICLVVFRDPCHTVSNYYFRCLLLN